MEQVDNYQPAPIPGGAPLHGGPLNTALYYIFYYSILVLDTLWRYFSRVAKRILGAERWKQYRDKERWQLQFSNRRIFVFCVALIWTFILWFGTLYKCFYESVTSFLSYFTNISFAYQAGFYLFYTISYFGDPRKRSLEFFVLFGFWWNVFAQTVIVFVLVQGVLLDAPGLLINETKTGGGQYDDGVVLLVNTIVHVCPIIFGLILLPFVWPDLCDIYVLMFARVYCLPKHTNGESLCRHLRCAFRVDYKQAWWYILFNYAAAFMPILLYYNIVNLREVYDLHDFKTYAAILLMFVINFFAVILPLIFMFYITIPQRDVPKELVADDEAHKVIVIPNGVPLPS